jgi:hypothetical protein
MNAQSFEVCEKMSSELHLWFLKSLFEWNFVNAPLNISNFVYFCTLFLGLYLDWCFFLVYIMCMYDALLSLLMNLLYF